MERAKSVRLTVTHRGAPGAPLLVLLHGLGDAGSAWGGPAACWGQRWHVVTPDLRGHGRSPRITPSQYDDVIGAMLVDVVRLLDDLKAPLVLGGHSLGGRLALLASIERPKQVRGLFLEDPAIGLIDHNGPDFGEQFWAFAKSVADDPVMSRARQTAASSWSADEVEAWASSKALLDEQMVRHIRFAALDSPALLNALTCPTLVVAPVDSAHIPPPSRVENDLVTFELLDEVGHCVHRDDPRRYHAAVDPFLAGLRKAWR